MIRTQISMTQDQANGLRKLAALRERSQSALLRDALDSLLGDASLDQQIAAARAVIGRHGSGRQDVSEGHDRELEIAFSS